MITSSPSFDLTVLGPTRGSVRRRIHRARARQRAGGERYELPDHLREDYLSSYEGDRLVESMRYVRTYPTELPVLRHLLAEIQIPVQIIAGARDPFVPLVNARFLHERLARSKLDVIDAGHFAWEDRADELRRARHELVERRLRHHRTTRRRLKGSDHGRRPR